MQVVSDVVQKDVRAQSHCKDVWTKMAHPFIRVLRAPPDFSPLNVRNYSSDKNIAIVRTLDVDVNASQMVDSVVAGTFFVDLSSPAK